MKKYFILTVFISQLLYLLGCDKKNDLITEPVLSIPSDSINVPLSPIDSEIFITLIEEINSSGRNVILSFYTKKIYSPGGSKIISSFSQLEDTINVELKELLISDFGTALGSPAAVKYNLGLLQEGNYLLNIMINNKKVLGQIKVTEGFFKLKIQPNNIIHFYKDTLIRVPKTIIWGQAESTNQISYRMFLDSLAILGAKYHELKAGYYYYFEVDSRGDFDTYSARVMPYGEYFLYSFESDTSLSRNLIKRFAKRYQDSIYIKLSGGRGENYYSTVLSYEP